MRPIPPVGGPVAVRGPGFSRILSSGAPIAAALFVSIACCTAGCAKKMAMAPPPPPMPSLAGTDSGRLDESLFKGDQAVLSNQDIDRILNARITLADRHRLAVLHLNPRTVWNPAVAGIETRNSERFLDALRSSSRLTQVRFMPGLLVPERRTVPYLREAAARFQADLLLVYGTSVRTFERDRAIGADEVRAQSVVESVLLDVRTGVVIHTAQAREDVSARRVPGDLNFAETVAKAQSEAGGRALSKLADAVLAFVAEP